MCHQFTPISLQATGRGFNCSIGEDGRACVERSYIYLSIYIYDSCPRVNPVHGVDVTIIAAMTLWTRNTIHYPGR